MGGHDTPAVLLGELDSVNRLADGTDLVDLQQQTVGCLGINGLLDLGWVCDSKIITDNLDLFSNNIGDPGGES